MKRAAWLTLFSLAFLFITGALPQVLLADASSTADIQSQIDAVNQQKAALDAEIAQDQAELDVLGGQHQTLQSSIKSISVTQSQLTAKISSTQKSITAANLELEQLGAQIGQTEGTIDTDKSAVAEALRNIQASDDVPIIEQVFGSESVNDIWTAIDTDNQLSTTLQGHTQDLAQAEQVLSTHQDAVTTQHEQLATLNSSLSTQNKQLSANKSAKQTLLTETQNQESQYQSLIAEKQAQEAQFEQTLQQLQAQLSPVAQSAVPHPGTGVLNWPFSASVMATCPGKESALGNPYCITQFFGNTPFATANPQIYNGMGHDGVDIGVPIGTPVEAALGGVVLATGDTDIKAPDGQECLSFGKWVMLQHANGLDTLYAHLSSIEVTQGQTVTTGEEIALSGMTGYATGPHLHFGVYASAGVQIMDLGKWRGSGGTPCTDAGAVLPVAPDNAYLNPMSYL